MASADGPWTVASDADLEIVIRRLDGDTAAADLRFSAPGDDGDIRLGEDVPVTLGVDALDAVAFDTEEYGRALGRNLLAADVGAVFARARQEAESNGVPLRVRLFVAASAGPLHRLRWETLRDPATGDRLLTSENILFSRYLTTGDWRRVAPAPRADLDAVVAIADPRGVESWGNPPLASIDVDAELARARTSLRGMRLVELASGGTATLDSLVDALRARPDVLYLVCHGFAVGGEPQLLLEAPDGSVARVPGAELVSRLRELPRLPRLVVLASCQSGHGGTTADDGALAGLGPRLADIGVPAVVAMQGNVTMATVETFMPAFFSELARDGQIDRAVAVARGKVRGNADWWMPVLYMRLKSGRLWYVPDDERGEALPGEVVPRPRWSTSAPSDLACFVSPDARRWLTLGRPTYDLGDRPEARLATVHAIYDALSQRHLTFADAPHRSADPLREVRTSEQLLGAGQDGNALDLTVLFGGLGLGNGLLPVVVVFDDHAVVLVSLERGASDLYADRDLFPTGVLTGRDGLERLVAQVDSGRYVAVECTGVARTLLPGRSAQAPAGAAAGGGSLPFEQATEAGRRALTERADRFRFALDVGWLHHREGKVPVGDLPAGRVPGAVVPREAKAPPGTFRGRDRELHQVRQAVLPTGDRRVAVISGMPGVGKSALAEAFATQPDVEAAFPDGTLSFDLNAVDVMTALEHVARVFGRSVADHAVLTSRVSMVRSLVQNQGARLLVLVDDAPDRHAVDVFRFRDCGLVVTTVDEQLADEPGTCHVPLGPLSEKDAAALLSDLVGERVGGKGAALRRMAAALGRLPLALELGARLVAKELEAGTGIDGVLAELESRRLDLGPRDRPVRAIFDTTYERALDERLRGRFAALGSFAPGSLPLEAVAASWGVDPAGAAADLRALTELSLVDGSRRRAYELQPLVRDYAVSKFDALAPADRLAVHERVADHYRRWLRAYEETNQEETLCWYRFEQADWQEAKSRYLFHLSRLQDRVAARLAYTGLFFDALWWWGSYVRFEYGDRLLVEWARAHGEDAEDVRWYEAMTGFARSYPLGPDKRGRGNWPSALRCLLDVRALAGVDGPGATVDAAERRHVRAITNQFLGQCHRYLDRFDDAAASYEESLVLLADGGEWWEVAWAHFAWADLELERGRPDEAEARRRAALAVDVEHPRRDLDVELRANLYRIEGDIAWEHGDPDRALACDALATFYAYRLQSSSHPPDIYALTFYREMKGRAVARLRRLVSSGRGEEADRGLATLGRFWEPYWRAAGAEPPVVPSAGSVADRLHEVVDALLAPEPSERKLTAGSVRYRRQFAREAEVHTAAMAAVLDPAAWPGLVV